MIHLHEIFKKVNNALVREFKTYKKLLLLKDNKIKNIEKDINKIRKNYSRLKNKLCKDMTY